MGLCAVVPALAVAEGTDIVFVVAASSTIADTVDADGGAAAASVVRNARARTTNRAKG